MATCGPWLEPTPVAGGLVEPQRPAGVLADPRLQPPGAGRDRHHAAAEPGTAHRQRARRLPRGQLRRRPQLRHVRQPGAWARPGTGAEVGNLTWALHNVWLSYRHTMDDGPAARHGLPGAAPGDQLLPALPDHRAATASCTCRARSRPSTATAAGLQLRPGADPLGLPDPARVRRTPRHRRPAGPALAGGARQARAVPGRRERLHDRRRTCRSRSRTGTTRTC